MDLDVLAALRTADGSHALAVADDLANDDPLSAVAKLRARGFGAEVASAALTQASLRRRAVAKFGPDAGSMFFTRTGLEQATRAPVAARRAARLAASGVTRIVDLCCGLGADAIAFARAGLAVIAVDADPLTAAIAAANAGALGLADRIEVRTAEATAVDLTGVEAAFCDPARRTDTGSGRRVFDPRAYSPPWGFLTTLMEQVPATVLKLAPGLDHELIPPGTEAEWVSVDGDLVEAALWCGPLAEVPRRASLVRSGETHELTGSGTRQAPVGEMDRFLHQPDDAVLRAHLVAEFAAEVRGVLADPQIGYVFAEQLVPTPFGRSFEVVEELPYPIKRLRTALHERGIGVLEIRKRGLSIVPDRLRRDLKLRGPNSATLVLTRAAGSPAALLCQPA